MKIVVHYPQIMKMEISSKLEVSDNASLKEIQEEVFNYFKQLMPSHVVFIDYFRKDGFVLKDRNVEIVDDETLRDRLSQGSVFQAVFKTLGEIQTKPF